MNQSGALEKTQLHRLAVEVAVIVVGVLVALIAGDWWAERDERLYEAELREDMVEEFRTNLEIQKSDLNTNYAIYASLNQFVELDDHEVRSLPDTAYSPWSAGDLSWAGFDPMMGSAQAQVESGNLGVIADRELRLLLSTWSGLLEEKTRYTEGAVAFQSLVFLPTAARLGADQTWTAEERREIHAILRTQRNRMRNVIRNQEKLSAAAQELLDYLQS